MPLPLEPGDILRERYVIRETIGRGGMGSIYLAEDNRLPGRLCALKEVEHDPNIPSELREQSRDQFYREASVLARLDHPNLPKVSDYFSEGDRDYLVMDFVPGEDLKTLMDTARRQGRFLPVDEVLGWADQLLDALVFLHAQDPPVIHRDIKPSNLKLTPGGLVKLVDFGLVKQMVPDEVTVTVIQGRGTALYTPLEQYGGDTGHTDPRSDIYAFSATFYHLLTNRQPTEAKRRFLRPQDLIHPTEINPAIPPTVEEAILWGMALHPDERPQSIEELRNAMEAGAPLANRSPELTTFQYLQRLLPTDVDRGLAAAAVFLAAIAAAASLL
ncbi:MAG: serine/threonine-protein kinase [Anaerolineales bacterium]|nr:serine/threonine-protein kinase [Anaerolineales bacterium]